MTQTNTTQNGNAINRIIERTDEITKRELSGNDPSYKIGDNPNEFYQNGTLPVQNASTQPTTQNKEELERKLIGKNVHSVYTLCNKCHSWGINIPLHEVCGNCNSDDTILYYDIETVNKSILEAHQSGIEEERKRIKTNIGFLRQWINEKPEKMLVTNEHIEEWLFNFEPLRGNKQ